MLGGISSWNTTDEVANLIDARTAIIFPQRCKRRADRGADVTKRNYMRCEMRKNEDRGKNKEEKG